MQQTGNSGIPTNVLHPGALELQYKYADYARFVAMIQAVYSTPVYIGKTPRCRTTPNIPHFLVLITTSSNAF